MKYLQQSLLIFFFSMILTSCEKTFSTIVDIDIPHTPIIALECTNITDSTFASITSTIPVTGATLTSILLNAKAYMYEDQILKDSFYLNNNIGYVSRFNNYISGKEYMLTVSAPNFKTVQARDICPSLVTATKTNFIKKAKTMVISEFSSSPQEFDEIKITFTDDAAVSDYYEVNVFIDSLGFRELPIVSTDIDIDEGDEEEFFSNTSNIVRSPFTMRDINFNGKEKTLVFYCPSALTDQSLVFLKVRFSHLSEAYYKYNKTRRLYDRTQGNPFAEPVQIFSNVENGVGVFALKKDMMFAF